MEPMGDPAERSGHPAECDCGGSGWLAVPDPIVEALIDTPCPGDKP